MSPLSKIPHNRSSSNKTYKNQLMLICMLIVSTSVQLFVTCPYCLKEKGTTYSKVTVDLFRLCSPTGPY